MKHTLMALAFLYSLNLQAQQEEELVKESAMEACFFREDFDEVKSKVVDQLMPYLEIANYYRSIDPTVELNTTHASEFMERAFESYRQNKILNPLYRGVR